jgi:hypothetical protein
MGCLVVSSRCRVEMPTPGLLAPLIHDVWISAVTVVSCVACVLVPSIRRHYPSGTGPGREDLRAQRGK